MPSFNDPIVDPALDPSSRRKAVRTLMPPSDCTDRVGYHVWSYTYND
jgi:hypothetical protein